MGDIMINNDVFKKLGFDTSSQYLLYDERFQKFFNFMSKHITDLNILSDHEVSEKNELQKHGQYLTGDDLKQEMHQLECNNPGLLTNTEKQIQDLTREIEIDEELEKSYTTLLDDMRLTKTQINLENHMLESEITYYTNAAKNQLLSCQRKAKNLEELQRDNLKLMNESKNLFIRMASPPLFINQLELDQYFLKCDSFLQHFNLYKKKNFKIQESIEYDNQNTDIEELALKLDELQKSIEHYKLEYIKEKSIAHATQSIIDLLDISKIHVITLSDMERETRELELINDHIKIAAETIMNDLAMHVHQRTQQHMESVLYENTKQKYDRALRRHENEKLLAKIISDALSNAELVWILTQLDLDRISNRFDNKEQINIEKMAFLRRLKYMKNLHIMPALNSTYGLFLEQFTEMLTQYTGQIVRTDAKSCLYEYEKFNRLLSYSYNNMLNQKSYTQALDQINELDRLENMLKPLVYDSPVKLPMFENVRYLRSIYNVRVRHQQIDVQLRRLRTLFKENITDKVDNDKYWRYNQLLWIWFLTDPKRVLMAIEEVRIAASKQPIKAGVKSLCGIKRK